MKVTLLGTGAAEGWPGLFCRCEACGFARLHGGKNIRTRSSALIDGTLKIDFPPDILHQVIANNINLCDITALLFTHEHDDHFCGAQLQYLGNYFVTEQRPEPLPIYGPYGVIRWLQQNLKVDRLPITLHTLEPWQVACIGGYRVLPIPAQHDPSTICFNYLLSDPAGTTLLYATDTGWYPESTWQRLEEYALDGIVCECQKGPQEGGYQGHLSLSDVIQMRDRLIAAGSLATDAPVAITHLSHMSRLAHHQWEACLDPYGIQTGFDGMNLEIPPPSPLSPNTHLHLREASCPCEL